jgi:tRNA(Ile)-lysidine synthase
MERMFAKIQRAIAQRGLFTPRDKILVAVSGGPDSVSLLDALAELHPNRLRIVHLNHRLRGKASDADEKFVRQLAKTYKIPVTVGRRDVKTLAKRRKMSIEEAARQARHEFFHRVARQTGVKIVALAHTADDQAETFLLRLLRGAGLRGLSAMDWKKKFGAVTIVRPMLGVWRGEVERYIRERGLEFRIDRSNLSKQFARNRVRHELLPLLESKFNPRIREVLWRTAEIVREDDKCLTEIARGHIARKMPMRRFLKLPKALQRRVLREWLGTAEFRGVEELLRKMRAPRPKRVRALQKMPTRFEMELVAHRGRSTKFCEFFDADALGAQISVRFWRAGDRFAPLGMRDGTKKLQDFFTDLKIPREVRAKIPLVCAENGEIAWVVGYRIGEKFKITPQTKRIARIRALASKAGVRG